MADNLFYRTTMEPGLGPNWDNAIARSVHSTLSWPYFINVPLATKVNLCNAERRSFFSDVRGILQKPPYPFSWTNYEGLKALVAFIQILVGNSVPASAVGVISMYGEDVTQTKQALKDVDLWTAADDKVEVSSVDAFQGRQKQVIIEHFRAAFNRSNQLCVGSTRG